MINCLFILQPDLFFFFDETKKSYPKEVGDYYENLLEKIYFCIIMVMH